MLVCVCIDAPLHSDLCHSPKRARKTCDPAMATPSAAVPVQGACELPSGQGTFVRKEVISRGPPSVQLQPCFGSIRNPGLSLVNHGLATSQRGLTMNNNVNIMACHWPWTFRAHEYISIVGQQASSTVHAYINGKQTNSLTSCCLARH